MTPIDQPDVGPDPVDDYLARLDDALRDVPFGMAREIRAGVAEELVSLEPLEARARIAELGPPEAIAAEAAADAPVAAPRVAFAAPPPSGYGNGPGYVAVTALLVGIGGLVLPIVGWVVGMVALWTGRVWTTFERWIATLAPIAATTIAVGVWWLAQSAAAPDPTPTSTGVGAPDMSASPMLGFVATWWIWWLGTSVASVVIGVWLLVVGMRRVRA